MANESQEEKKDKKKKDKKKIIIIGLISIFVIVLVVVGVTQREKINTVIKDHFTKPEPVLTKKFDDIVVNLTDKPISHYLRVAIVIEYQGEKLGKEIQEKSYRLKDGIISVIRSKSSADLDATEETYVLKQELINVINQQLTEGEIGSLYFENFIMQ